MRFEPVLDDDPRVILRALRAALGGAGPALGLGVDDSGEVPAGTVAVLATSGSSGYPKSVVLSRSALTSSALATTARIGAGAWLLALPATYIAGLQVLVRSLVHGREPAIIAGRFSASSFVAAADMMASSVGGHRIPNYTSLVPAQLATLLRAAVDDSGVASALRSFEAILVGGQMMPAALLGRARDLDVRIVRTYGSTETSGGCVYDGVPLDGVRIEVTEGEVRIGGPMLGDGYLDDDALTAERFITDPSGSRWYRSGDAGEFRDGVLRIRGRLDNVIVSGGINISLDRVEQIVRTLPGLEAAVVIGVPDERWGEAAVIVALHQDGQPVGEAQLQQAREAVAAQIGEHARPTRLLRLDDLPTLSSGKPDREAMRREITRRP